MLAAGLTLFSGFGLGTLLMPVVALFFPLELAITITAIVHLANNIFKVALVGRQASWPVIVNFGIPAVAAAFLGAALLYHLSESGALFTYEWMSRTVEVTLIKLVIGLLILFFILLELSPGIARLSLSRQWLPLGGLVSGFFGGLSGHQGALRSIFLLKSGIGKEAYIATAAVLAMMVDISRVAVYGWNMQGQAAGIQWHLVFSATLAAFMGTYLGSRFIAKVTLELVQKLVATLLAVIALGLITGML